MVDEIVTRALLDINENHIKNDEALLTLGKLLAERVVELDARLARLIDVVSNLETEVREIKSALQWTADTTH